MLEAQSIPFVCEETDWMAQFQSNYEMQPGMPAEKGEIITLRALLSEKTENHAEPINTSVPGRCPGGRVPPVTAIRTLRNGLSFPGDRWGL